MKPTDIKSNAHIRAGKMDFKVERSRASIFGHHRWPKKEILNSRRSRMAKIVTS